MDLAVIQENFPFLMKGLRLTVIFSMFSITICFFTGMILALLRLSKRRFISYPVTAYIEVVRATPFLMVVFWVFFMIPVVTKRPVSPIVSALISFVLFTSTYIAEVIRSGIQSISKGQMEAARVTGLRYMQAMGYIIFPQALKNMLPALVSRFIALFKASSLVYFIGVMEFFRHAVIVNNREFRSYEIFSFVAIVYFICCYSMSLFASWLEKRMHAYGMKEKFYE